MDVKKDLKEMAARTFTPELLEQILDDFNKNISPVVALIDEEECERSRQKFAALLNEEQAALLDNLEKQHRAMAQYSLEFGFSRGLFAGFEILFSESYREKPFEDLILHEAFTMPNMKRYPFFMWRDKINQGMEALTSQLGFGSSYLAERDVYWSEKILGTLRYTFYLGLRCAQSIAASVGPFSLWIKMQEKMLTVEHELGFTKTVSEREAEKMAGQIIPPPEWLRSK